MTDLRIDPATGDLDLEFGEARVVSDAREVAQRIRHRLRTFRGDWFLDADRGIPYLQEILAQKRSTAMARARALLRAEILGTPDVVSLDKFEMIFDGSTRALAITFIATTTRGLVEETVHVLPEPTPDPIALPDNAYYVGYSTYAGASQVNTLDFGNSLTIAPVSGTKMVIVKRDFDTYGAVAAWKVLETTGGDHFGPWGSANRATGDLYVAFCVSNDSVSVNIYDAASDTVAVKAYTTSPGGNVFLVKYDKDGAYQWSYKIRRSNPTVGGHAERYGVFAQDRCITILPSGNVIIGVAVGVQNPSGSGAPETTTVYANDGTTDTTLHAFPSVDGDTSLEGLFAEFTAAGAFVDAVTVDITAGSGRMGPVVMTDVANAAGFAVGFAGAGETTHIRWGSGEANEINATLGNEGKALAFTARYAITKALEWGAPDLHIADPYALTAGVDSIAMDASGNVYTVVFAKDGTSEANKRIFSKSASTAMGTTPTASRLVPHDVQSADCPVLVKRNASGVVQWQIALGPSSGQTSSPDSPRTMSVAVDGNNKIWIARTLRRFDSIVLDEGLDSEVTIDANASPFIRGYVARLDPADGHMEVYIPIKGTTGNDPWVTAERSGRNGAVAAPPIVVHAIDSTRIAVGLDTALGALQIGATTLAALAGSRGGADIAIFDASTGDLLNFQQAPASGLTAGACLSTTFITSAQV